MRFLTALAAALISAGLARAETVTLDLVGPISDYKIYVSEKLDKLVEDTKAFTGAVKAGDVARAKALFAPTRQSYEAIEPIAELFSDLDSAIDSRADDHEKAEADPSFTGFHRIEFGLWTKNSTDGLNSFADKLLNDVTELRKRIVDLPLPPEKVVGGAAALMEEVAATKISGEEDRYSHTDLWDFRGNFDGAYKIVELVRPLIAQKEEDFLKGVDDNFNRINATLSKYKEGEGYVSYEKLSEADRKVLAAAVNKLAEDLSTLRAKLGLD
ncbi:MAG: Efem/EfeO family lipoprotein [Rhizobiales bacterium 65-9]|nr:iron uptake system protein EfeO [Hyphomicrobiales bacterium]OJY38981.1 MAG: Efem/EfeO family lipoprotein [Rhizobiales bacterium 65-9]